MNPNTENTEKYAWVDAELENRALQEQQQEQAMEVEDENPEWNEDTGLFNCKNCNAEFATDRQLEYHQMVCKPGNNILCADFLERPPPLTRQNACPLMTVVDEITGEIICVEEEQDDALYECKHANILWAPIKKQEPKTCNKYEPIPMEICDDIKDYMSENDDLEPRELFPDDEEDDLLSVMSDIDVESLEQGENPLDDIIYPVFDENGVIYPIPMGLDLELGPHPSFRRANTQWQDPVTGETVYNGNPNGSRFFDEGEGPEDLIADIIIT